MLLSAKTKISYDHTVNNISICGSWLNDIDIPYFFLDPSFGQVLELCKENEKQRYAISQYFTQNKLSLATKQLPEYSKALQSPISLSFGRRSGIFYISIFWRSRI